MASSCTLLALITTLSLGVEMVVRDWQQRLADARAWWSSCLCGLWSTEKDLGVEPGLLRVKVVAESSCSTLARHRQGFTFFTVVAADSVGTSSTDC
eukprot:1125716-Rhodomonas_salina.1